MCEKLLENGVLSKETHETVIRFAPPLNISNEGLDFALSQFAKTLSYFEQNLKP
jgi:ornithine--oxo-acid transaminase